MGLGNGLFLLIQSSVSLSPPLRLKSDPVTSNESTGRSGIKKETVNKWLLTEWRMADLIVGTHTLQTGDQK